MTDALRLVTLKLAKWWGTFLFWLHIRKPKQAVKLLEVTKEVTDEEHWQSAWHHFERWYRKVVQSYVEYYDEYRIEWIEDALSNEDDVIFDELREHLDEWLHETIDGCQEVIYNNQAAVVCLISPNEDAVDDYGFGEPPTVNVRAFCALKRDVEERIFG